MEEITGRDPLKNSDVGRHQRYRLRRSEIDIANTRIALRVHMKSAEHF
jgi:hypothetical protein